jgi:hypothetical protein
VRKRIIVAIGGLALLAGCGSSTDKNAGIPINKWKGLPYRITFDKPTAKPNPTAISLPPIKFTANPDALETRTVLVIKFDVPGAKNQEQPEHHMIASPTDIKGEEGSLSPEYIERASKDLSSYLNSYCADGKVTMSVALGRSSLNPQAGEAEIERKRLSDWIPTDAVIKKPHGGKC